MTDKNKTRIQLIEELLASRNRVAELEQELSTSRQHADYFQIANLATWVWEIQSNCVKVREEHGRMFGTEPDYLDNNALEQFLKLVHPDDRERWNGYFETCISNKLPGDICYRIIRQDGTERILIDRFDIVCDEAGTPTYIFGSTQDITESKQVKDQLRQEKEFSEGVIETARFIILMLDIEGKIVRFNPFMEEISGYSLDEVRGRDWITTFIPKQERERISGIFHEAMRDIKTQGNVNSIVTRDGRECTIEWYDTTIKDNDGNVTGLLAIGDDISQRCDSERALHDREKQYHSLVTNIPGAVYRCDPDSDWSVHYISDAIEEISGYPASDFISRIRSYASIIHPDDRQMVEDLVYNAIECKQSYELKYRIINSNSEVRWVDEKGQAVFDADGKSLWLDGVIFDETENKRAEDKLNETSHRLQHLIDALPVYISYLNSECEILFVNRSSEYWLKIPREEIIGKHVSKIIHNEEFLKTREYYERALAGETTDFDSLLEDENGKQYFHVIHVPDIQDGQVKGIFVLRTDIRERKHTEAELIEAKELAEEACTAKSMFLGRMSHELRTPLNAILGFAQVMQIANDDETIGAHRDGLDIITRSGWHLLRIINDLLNLSAIEANKIILNYEDINVNDCLHACFELLSPLARESGVTFSCLDDTCDGMIVRADRFRLDEVLINLLANAVKYNRDGGSVTISCQHIADRIRILVSDTGEGIPESELPSLFQPFSRLTKRPYNIQGAGIGLSIANQLIELMGGTIGVESIYGKGSTFWIDLPGEKIRETDIATMNASATVLNNFALDDQATLLYVEDNPDHVDLVREIISQMDNLSLLTTHTPSLGLDLARAHRPDLILLDICLPGMSGYQVLELLKADKHTKNIPVMAISASAIPAEIENGLQAGFRRYLTKPLNVVEFKKIVMELLHDNVS